MWRWMFVLFINKKKKNIMMTLVTIIKFKFFFISSLNNMEFEEIRLIISKAIEQTKTHQIDLLMRWLDGILLKYRESTLCKFYIFVLIKKKNY
jgi:hypothetical protein